MRLRPAESPGKLTHSGHAGASSGKVGAMRLQSAESPGRLTLSGAGVGGVFCEGEQREGVGQYAYDLLRAPTG